MFPQVVVQSVLPWVSHLVLSHQTLPGCSLTPAPLPVAQIVEALWHQFLALIGFLCYSEYSARSALARSDVPLYVPDPERLHVASYAWVKKASWSRKAGDRNVANGAVTHARIDLERKGPTGPTSMSEVD